jgi:hypothetical protein
MPGEENGRFIVRDSPQKARILNAALAIESGVTDPEQRFRELARVLLGMFNYSYVWLKQDGALAPGGHLDGRHGRDGRKPAHRRRIGRIPDSRRGRSVIACIFRRFSGGNYTR